MSAFNENSVDRVDAALRRTRRTIRSTTALTSNRPAYAAGFRAAISTVVPLVVSAALGSTLGTWMSLGGFSCAISDRGGSYRSRATTMATITICCAIAVILGSVGGETIVVAVPLAFLVALVASLARVWGNDGASVGGSTLSTFVIAVAYPSSFADSLGRAGLVLVGGLWAMIVALLLWPLRPYRPARLAVAQSYRALAEYVDQVADAMDHSLLSDSRTLPIALPLVRTALENAREVLTRIRHGRPGASRRGDQLVVLAEAADQLFGHIVGVAEIIEGIPRLLRDPGIEWSVLRVLREVANSARDIANGVEEEDEAKPIPLQWNGDAILSRVGRAGDTSAGHGAEAVQYAHAATIFDRAAQYAEVAAHTVADLNGNGEPDPSSVRVADEIDTTTPVWVQARAILSPGSLLFRFALRVAVVTSAAVLLAEAFGLKRGYWMTLTVIVIMQPYTGATSQRALQRIVGTVLGGILTAVLGALIHDPLAIMALAFIFVTLCVALLPVNYVAFSIFLTPTFVLLAEASAGDWHLAGTRVFNTLLGGGLAWLGGRILWPSPEAMRLPEFMVASLRANLRYLDRVIHSFGDTSEEASRAILQMRRAAGLAASNTDESFQRFVGEHAGRSEDLSAAMTFATYARRLTASIVALALVRHAGEKPPPSVLETFYTWAAGTLNELIDALTSNRPPAPHGEIPSLSAADRTAFPILWARVERIARQLGTLHDAVERWAMPG